MSQDYIAGVTRVRKFFLSHKSYFNGTIIKIPKQRNGFYKIRYDDGDEEEMTEKEVARGILNFSKFVQRGGNPNAITKSQIIKTKRLPQGLVLKKIPKVSLPKPLRKLPSKDSNAPKRSVGPFLHFQNAMRDKFKAENPGVSFGELSKLTSIEYAKLTPASKTVWEETAKADRDRYEKELSMYTPPPGYDAKGDAVLMPTAHYSQYTTKQYNKLLKMSKQRIRDEHAPKRYLSPYLLYQNAMRDTFKKEFPQYSFGQLSKHTSLKYRDLSPEEKKVWEEKSAADKARFDAEMKEYKPSPGFDEKGMKLELDLGPFSKKKKGKKYRDPDAPKRCKGSFVYFTEDVRPKLITEFPEMTFIEMGHLLGERWRALTPEQRKVYEEKAQVGKLRYQEEMKVYQAKIAENPPPSHFPQLDHALIMNNAKMPHLTKNAAESQVPSSGVDANGISYETI